MRKLTGLALMLLGVAGIASAGGPLAVPEIDPATGASALALLAGGLLILRARKSKR